MTPPAVSEHQSPLEVALDDVRTTLAQLLVAADEQYAAVVAHDRDQIESVTRQQERLSARLARAEARRLKLLAGTPLSEALSALPKPEAARLDVLRKSIAAAVLDLKQRQAVTSSLLSSSIELGEQTLAFLQRLVTAPSPAYNVRGVDTPRHSVLVDGRA